AAQITADGQRLNGGSGDDFFGDPQGLFRLYGDANGDRRVDVQDLGLFAGTYLKASPDPLYLAYLDVNADGRVDVADLGQSPAATLPRCPAGSPPLRGSVMAEYTRIPFVHFVRPARRPRARLRLSALEGRLAPATFTVTNDTDAGTGSLRQAVLDANGHSGAD